MKKKKNSRGFTLIELLAVIIILGILMIIAIPSVTSYINNSRKSAYVSTAKEIIGGARTFVNEGKLEMFDTTTTYYIPVSCISTENGQKSPYGDFVENQAFVIVTYTGSNYNYYWISRDTTGQGVKTITPVGELDEDDIVSDISAIEITPTEPAEEGKNTIKVLSKDDCKTFGEGSGGNGGGTTPTGIATYKDGTTNEAKTKDTVDVGDIVTIGTEEFYVIKPLTDGKLTLLSHYNLNVGSNKKAGATEGLQDSEVKGWVSSGTKYGNLAFSSTNYWNGKVGSALDYTESYCSSNTYTAGTKCAYVYDSNSNLKTYVDAYKDALIEMGQPIQEARLLRVEEAFELGCGKGARNCNSAPAFVKETSYWLGSAYNSGHLWVVTSGDSFVPNHYSSGVSIGIRPVIII